MRLGSIPPYDAIFGGHSEAAEMLPGGNYPKGKFFYRQRSRFDLNQRSARHFYGRILTAIFCLLIFPFTARAEVKCDREQVRCLVDGSEFTIGDKVGFFNSQEELVAVGTIRHMSGNRRTVLVTKRFGLITKSSSVRLIKDDGLKGEFGESIKLYKRPVRTGLGVSAEIATLTIGEPNQSYVFGGHYQYGRFADLDLLGRVMLSSSSAEVSQSDIQGVDTQPFELITFGLMPAIGKTLFYNYPVSINLELGAGLLYVNGKIGGDASLLEDPDFEIDIRNGVTGVARAAAQLFINFDSWHLAVGGSYSIFPGANLAALGIGVVFDLSYQTH